MSKIDNTAREQRKQKLEAEMLEIQYDELVEAACERGSWFRENFKLAPETSSFWSALPRYIDDCIKIPRHVSSTLAQIYKLNAIEKYRREYR
jgi:hypothetical protein